MFSFRGAGIHNCREGVVIFMTISKFQAIALQAKKEFLEQVEEYRNTPEYCEHGTYVGSWWGPDYLCGGCEEGYTITNLDAYRRGLQVARNWEIERLSERVVSFIEFNGSNRRTLKLIKEMLEDAGI